MLFSWRVFYGCLRFSPMLFFLFLLRLFLCYAILCKIYNPYTPLSQFVWIFIFRRLSLFLFFACLWRLCVLHRITFPSQFTCQNVRISVWSSFFLSLRPFVSPIRSLSYLFFLMHFARTCIWFTAAAANNNKIVVRGNEYTKVGRRVCIIIWLSFKFNWMRSDVQINKNNTNLMTWRHFAKEILPPIFLRPLSSRDFVAGSDDPNLILQPFDHKWFIIPWNPFGCVLFSEFYMPG